MPLASERDLHALLETPSHAEGALREWVCACTHGFIVGDGAGPRGDVRVTFGIVSKGTSHRYLRYMTKMARTTADASILKLGICSP